MNAETQMLSVVPSAEVFCLTLCFATGEKVCIRDLCLTSPESTQYMYFSCLFYSVPFAGINLSHEYNLLLRPSGE